MKPKQSYNHTTSRQRQHYHNNDDEPEGLSHATLERWSEMAEKMKGKLREAQRENGRLREEIDYLKHDINELTDEKETQVERIDDLEYQCMEKSSKISNLMSLLEAKNFTDEQESLLQKSMEHAELSLCVDRLRTALKKCASANQQLSEENKELKSENDELQEKLDEADVLLGQVNGDKERNRKFLLEIGELLQELNDTSEGGHEDGAGGSSSLEAIKRKMRSIEKNRRQLIRECRTLREENDSQSHRIQELERLSRSWTSTEPTRSSPEPHSPTTISGGSPSNHNVTNSEASPLFSMDTDLLNRHVESNSSRGSRPRFPRPHERDHVYEEDASATSSFSDLDPPNFVPLQDHVALKTYYEEALQRVVQLGTDLGKANAENHEKQNYIDELRQRLEEMKLERDAAKHETEEALNLAENAAGKHQECTSSLKQELKALQEEYNHLDKQYSVQLEELEKQIEQMEKSFRLQCDGLQKQHEDKLKVVADEKEVLIKTHKKEVDELQLNHKAAMEAGDEKLRELNEEFDVFMEMHTQMEDDLEDMQKKYDEALSNIVDLEDQLEKTKAARESYRQKSEKKTQEQSKSISNLKSSLEKAKNEIKDMIVQQQRMRRENDVILAKNGDLLTQLSEAKEKHKRENEQIESLRENCCDMEDRLKKTERNAASRYQQLELSYQQAMAKIGQLVHDLHHAGITIGDCDGPDAPNDENIPAHERIKRIEHELQGRHVTRLPPPTVDHDESFFGDYKKALHSFFSEVERNCKQPLWYDRLVHQRKISRLNRSVLSEYSLNFCNWSSTDPRLSISNLIRHEQDWRPLRNEMMSKVLSKFKTTENVPETELEKATENVGTSPAPMSRGIDIVPASPVDTKFLEHQRRLTAVNYDVVARAQLLQSPKAMAFNEDWKDPEDIGEAKATLHRMKGETQKIKMAANTAKIRYEAREKELRVVRMQYQKLQEKYNQAKKNRENLDDLDYDDDSNQEESTSRVKSVIAKMQNDAELQRVQNELRATEVKLTKMTSELRETKSKAEDALKIQAEGERNLQAAIGSDFKTPESSLYVQEHQNVEIFRDTEIHGSRSIDVENNREVEHGKPSFDGSHLTSVAEISCSIEGRDEMCEGLKGGTIGVEGGIGGYIQLQKDHDKALRTIEKLRSDLADATSEVEHAKTQLKRREENLRDVIREYNQLKDQCDNLISQIQEQVEKEEAFEEERKEDSIPPPPAVPEDLIRERNVALGKISLLEEELEEARKVAKAAHKKRLLREEHLRQVIDQYKVLEQEHKKTLSDLEDVRCALSKYGYVPGMEVRQKSMESDETRVRRGAQESSRDKVEENTIHSDEAQQGRERKAKPKLKAWFRDLGQRNNNSSRPRDGVNARAKVVRC